LTRGHPHRSPFPRTAWRKRVATALDLSAALHRLATRRHPRRGRFSRILISPVPCSRRRKSPAHLKANRPRVPADVPAALRACSWARGSAAEQTTRVAVADAESFSGRSIGICSCAVAANALRSLPGFRRGPVSRVRRRSPALHSAGVVAASRCRTAAANLIDGGRHAVPRTG